MSTVNFQSKGNEGSVPFPRNADEWQYKRNPATGNYFTPQEAEHKVAQDVFGHDYKIDQAGNPIERGKGSATQVTAQHQQELARAEQTRSAARARLGWSPNLEGAFDPRTAPPAAK